MLVAGIAWMLFAVARLLLAPFAIAEEIRDRVRRSTTPPPTLSVSVVVPAYNEGVVLDGCVRSIIAHAPAGLEVVLVDDGSTDGTFSRMRALAAEFAEVSAMTQENAGKAAALNAGIARTSGSIVLLVDADGVFTAQTFTELLRPFADPTVAAVCGDDRPVNLDRVQTRFLAVIGHVGTGLMRRAQSFFGVLPVVSGNAGAFRRAILDAVGPLRAGCIGEDLELTWRIHRAHGRVVFAPRAVVYAESPSTLRELWRQRVRWGRGLLQTVRVHADLIGRPRYGLFGLSLVPLLVASVVLPVAQVAALPLLAITLMTGAVGVDADIWGALLWLGLPVSAALVLLAVCLNDAWADLRHAYALPLWPAYSMMMSAVMVAAIAGEARGRPAAWNKLVRTGVRSPRPVGAEP